MLKFLTPVWWLSQNLESKFFVNFPWSLGSMGLLPFPLQLGKSRITRNWIYKVLCKWPLVYVVWTFMNMKLPAVCWYFFDVFVLWYFRQREGCLPVLMFPIFSGCAWSLYCIWYIQVCSWEIGGHSERGGEENSGADNFHTNSGINWSIFYTYLDLYMQYPCLLIIPYLHGHITK